MLVIGFGMASLVSQLGDVTVSALSAEESSEVGGPQNTAPTASFLAGIPQKPDVSEQVKSQANVNLAAGAPFISGKDVRAQVTQAGASADLTDEVIQAGLDRELHLEGRDEVPVFPRVTVLATVAARDLASSPRSLLWHDSS